MTGNHERDDWRRADAALDRAIDDALAEELRGGPGDLRARVLARLAEPVEARPSRWSALFRPAMLPAAGAALIVVGVAVSWWQADEQLSRAGAGRSRREQPAASARAVAGSRTPAAAPAPAGETSAASSVAAAPARTGRRTGAADNRVFAASWLGMDNLSRPKGLAADTVTAGEDEDESFLPGAVGGDLGDPIKPIPRPRPIAISPIVTAPVVAAPIVDAPPVSTLATTVSTLSGDSSSRDQTGPGKPGGVRP
jgi:hypothetical protein